MVSITIIGFTNMARYIYPKNKHIYQLLWECKMKDPTTGEWKEAVIYSQVLNSEGQCGEEKYVREKQDFLNKFQAVNN